MGKRILLITNNQCSTPYPVFPLGLAHVGAALKLAGHAIKIVDMLDTEAVLEGAVYSFKPHYIGISQRNIDDLNIQDCTRYADSLLPIVTRVRRASHAPIILGGSGFSLFPREILARTGADYGIQGEAEQSLPQLINALQGNGPLQRVAGLTYRCGNRIRLNPQKPLPPGRIPLARRPRSLCRWYLKRSVMLNLQTQRGCPFTCCYCTYPVIEGRHCRRRDCADLGDELQAMKKMGCRYFFIVDSVFNTSEAHVTSFCEEIIRRNISMSWGCFLRPKGVTASLMALMARAGLTHIEFGSDSLCDRTLHAYGKQFTFSDIYRASECARASKVHYAHFLIMGGPGETEATVREAYGNSKRLRRTVFFPFVGMRIYPRTPLHRIARREGVIRENADLIAPRFYLSPRIREKKLFELLHLFHADSPQWIVNGIPASLENVIMKLRAKGIPGPLWEFLAR